MRTALKYSAVAVLLAGSWFGGRACNRGEVAPPVPDAVVIDMPVYPFNIDEYAETGSRRYIKALGDEAETSAKNADKFTDWNDWFEDWQKRNIARHKNEFIQYSNALNLRAGGKYDGKNWIGFKNYDPKLAAELATDAAKGYRKVSP